MVMRSVGHPEVRISNSSREKTGKVSWMKDGSSSARWHVTNWMGQRNGHR